MPRRYPDDQVKDVTVDEPSPGYMWAWDSNGSRCINSNFDIRVLPKTNTHSVTNFLSLEGETLVTVSPSINGSLCLIIFNNDLVAQPHTTYREIF